jgi:hypothetical protein
MAEVPFGDPCSRERNTALKLVTPEIFVRRDDFGRTDSPPQADSLPHIGSHPFVCGEAALCHHLAQLNCTKV